MTNTIPNARLYLRSDAGSRLLVDISRNGAFADDPTELVDNSWNPVFDSGGGPGEGDRTGPATTNLSAGAYTIRLQYEEGTAYEDMHLMRDGGISLAPYAGKIYRINGVAGRCLFFDRLVYHTGLADWELCGPEDQRAAASVATSITRPPPPHNSCHPAGSRATGSAARRLNRGERAKTWKEDPRGAVIYPFPFFPFPLFPLS